MCLKFRCPAIPRDMEQCRDGSLHRYHATLASTFVCDLAHADVRARQSYDCFLLPNTLWSCVTSGDACGICCGVVKPGGVILAATAAFGPLEPGGADYWRMTAAAGPNSLRNMGGT